MMVMMVNDVDPKISYDVLPILPPGTAAAPRANTQFLIANIQRVIFLVKY
jgi:hypothetical protein